MDEKFTNEETTKNTLSTSEDFNNALEDNTATDNATENEAEELEDIHSSSQEPIEEPCFEETCDPEPSTYAFKWDYNTQVNYDRRAVAGSPKTRGAFTYITILIVTFMLSVSVVIASVIIGNSIQASGFKEHIPMKYDNAVSLDELYQVCLPSYVAISVTRNGGEGAGSGIIITEDGYICTNYHVVESHEKITVVTHDKKEYTATYIDGDETNDVAIIKIDAQNLPKAALGNSSETRVGERVIAIGTPFSKSYSGSMTSGYVSGVDRLYAIRNDNGTLKKTFKFIQTDTSINPGNSGGPLYNMNGEVIGIVTLKIAGNNYEGMGFAIPIDGVKDMIFDIIENGRLTNESAGSAIKGAALGISGHTVQEDQKYLIVDNRCITVQTDEDGDYIEWTSNGLFLEKIYVTDTDALDAIGLEDAYPYHAPATGVLIKATFEGFDSFDKLLLEDIIISANGISCNDMEILQNLIQNHRVGDVLELEVFRNGEIITVNVKLGASVAMD